MVPEIWSYILNNKWKDYFLGRIGNILTIKNCVRKSQKVCVFSCVTLESQMPMPQYIQRSWVSFFCGILVAKIYTLVCQVIHNAYNH